MRPGGTPSRSSRITRHTSTVVLPEPAFAETHAELPGSEACACGVSCAEAFALIRPPTIP